MVPNVDDLSALLYLRADIQPHQLYARYLLDGRATGPTEERTYADLAARAEAIAAHLQALGVGTGPALMLYPPGLAFVDALFGCSLAGVIGVPVYAPNPARLKESLEQTATIAADCGACCIFSTPDIIERFGAAVATTPGLSHLPWVDTTAVDTGDSPRVVKPAPSDPLYLQYTSGSTGQRKGVIVTHENLLENSRLIAQGFSNGPELNGVSWLPVQHDMGLVGGVIQPFAVGGRITLMSPFDFLRFPARWLEAISTFQADVSGGPDFGFAHTTRLAKDRALEGLDLSNWRLAFTGAEPVRPETMAAFTQRFGSLGFNVEAFYPCYGMAETTLIISGGRSGDGALIQEADADALESGQVTPPTVGAPIRQLVGSGHPLGETEMLIVDPEGNTPLSPGWVGEIWVRGRTVSPGYWGNPEATREAFLTHLADGRGPYLRTGDMGVMDEAGEIYITGRIKDLIIIRGRNIYPQDLESTAEAAHEAVCVGEVAAFSVEDGRQEELIIVAAMKQRVGVTVEQVLEAIRSRLGVEHQVTPGHIELIRRGQIPKTGSGKLQRAQCRRLYLERAFQPWQESAA